MDAQPATRIWLASLDDAADTAIEAGVDWLSDDEATRLQALGIDARGDVGPFIGDARDPAHAPGAVDVFAGAEKKCGHFRHVERRAAAEACDAGRAG